MTSQPTSSSPGDAGELVELGRLIDDLPPERAEPVFTHSSWATDRASSYERLEFLGDSVLELAIARELYDRFPEFTEGKLAKIRSHVVSRASCAVVSRRLGLGRRLAATADALPDDEVARLAKNRNVLAALLEAALAAIFLEHGFARIERSIVAAFQDRIEYALSSFVDAKTELQEALARTGRQVSYAVMEVEGPPHDRRFTCSAVVDGRPIGLGVGRSKKAAEQQAAKEALEALGVEPEPLGEPEVPEPVGGVEAA